MVGDLLSRVLSRVLFSIFLKPETFFSARFVFNEKGAKKKKVRAVGFEPVTGRLLTNVVVHSTISALFEHKLGSVRKAFYVGVREFDPGAPQVLWQPLVPGGCGRGQRLTAYTCEAGRM